MSFSNLVTLMALLRILGTLLAVNIWPIFTPLGILRTFWEWFLIDTAILLGKVIYP